jgi:hypothetical protein
MKVNMKKLALAVGSILSGLAVLPSAEAVNVAQDGLGQTILFPFYTVRNGWNTLINITNTSANTVVMKVRFHEARNSRDVFDFDVALSPYDVWNGTVSAGAGGVPMFTTLDKSCTVPAIPATGQLFQGGGANALLALAGDGGPQTTDRMSEGYINVIMMGIITPGNAVAGTLAGTIAAAVRHTAGTPANCTILQNAFALNGSTYANLQGAFTYAGNPLKGAFSLVNPASGWNASSEAFTTANFYDPTVPGAAVNLVTAQLPPAQIPLRDPAVGGGVFTLPAGAATYSPADFNASFHEPELSSTNTIGTYLSNADVAVSSVTPTNANQISNIITARSVINQWADRDAAISGNGWTVHSDWVITFPTKRFYVDDAANEYSGKAPARIGRVPAAGTRGGFTAVPLPAATGAFGSAFSAAGSCDDITVTPYDREEQTPGSTSVPVFSPASTGTNQQLCAEANVLTFDNTGATLTATKVLGTPIGAAGSGSVGSSRSVPTGYENGWAQLNFTVNNTTGAKALPTIGFAVINRTDPSGNGLNESYIVKPAYLR